LSTVALGSSRFGGAGAKGEIDSLCLNLLKAAWKADFGLLESEIRDGLESNSLKFRFDLANFLVGVTVGLMGGDLEELEPHSSSLVVSATSLKAKSRRECNLSSLRYNFFSVSRLPRDLRPPTRLLLLLLLLVAEYTLKSELESRENEDVDSEEAFRRLLLDGVVGR